MEEEYELELCYTTKPRSGIIMTNKYTYGGVCVLDYYHDVSKPVCQKQNMKYEKRMIDVQFQAIRDRSKYTPHQGKKECARRIKNER